MIRIRLLAAIAGLCLVATSAPADDEAAKNLAAWQGTWKAVSFLSDGKPSTAEQLERISLEVKDTGYLFRNGTFSERGAYRFDITKDPRELDIVVGEGKDQGKVHLVIYQVEGDQLAICLQKDNRARPREFTGAAGSGCLLEKWQRVPPATKSP